MYRTSRPDLLNVWGKVRDNADDITEFLVNQFGASNLESQIGNYGNFIAYLLMGIPAGMLLKRIGYKKTALLALVEIGRASCRERV